MIRSGNTFIPAPPAANVSAVRRDSGREERVISGFIIVWTNRNNFQKPERLGSYICKRLTRIYPAYFVVWIISAFVVYRLSFDSLCHPGSGFWNSMGALFLTSGMYGHRVGAPLGMGYVRRPHPVTPEWIAATRFEIGVGARRVRARAQLGAWYDPKNERVKA